MSATAAAAAGAAATALFVVTALASEIDGAIRAKNAKKARNLTNQLNAVIRKNNIQQDQLDAELSKINLNYNQLMQALEGVSRAGRAFDIQQQALKEYKEKQLTIEDKKRQLQQQTELASNALSSEISHYENKGLYDAIGGIFN